MKRKKSKIKVTIKKKRKPSEEVAAKRIPLIGNALIICILPVLAFFLYQFVSTSDWMDTMPKLSCLALYGIAYFYLFLVAYQRNTLAAERRDHFYRFTVVFVIGLGLCIGMTWMPYLLWPYLILCVWLTIFSNMQIAMGAFLYLLSFHALLAEMQMTQWIVFCLIGMTGIVLFSDEKVTLAFRMPLFEALLCQSCFLLLLDFSLQRRLTFDAALFVAIQLFVSFMVLLISLKVLCLHVLHKDFNRYQEINDPEYVLLTELKKRNSKEYYHAIHTAYFCEKIARKIGADEMLAKAGGYYHRIGLLRGNKNLKNLLAIAREHRFPPALVQLLKEYGTKNVNPTSKETAIVIYADAMVSSVSFLYEQDKDAKLDFERVANVVFQKQMDSGILKDCEITMKELSVIRNTFMEENLYYDFLR